MQICKPLSELEASELILCCSTNFSTISQHLLLIPQEHFEFGPSTIRTQVPSQDQQFAQPIELC